jgi:hypothetical protein
MSELKDNKKMLPSKLMKNKYLDYLFETEPLDGID